MTIATTVTSNNHLPVRPSKPTTEKNHHSPIHYKSAAGQELTSVLVNGPAIRAALYEGREPPKELRAFLFTADYEIICAIAGPRAWLLNQNTGANTKWASKAFIRFGGNPTDVDGVPIPKSIARFLADLIIREQTGGARTIADLPKGTAVVAINGNFMDLTRYNIGIRMARDTKNRIKSKVIRITDGIEIKGR